MTSFHFILNSNSLETFLDLFYLNVSIAIRGRFLPFHDQYTHAGNRHPKKPNQFLLHCKRQILHGQLQLLKQKQNKQTRNWFNKNFWYFIIYFHLILIMKKTTTYQQDVRRPLLGRFQLDSGRHRFKALIHILHKPRNCRTWACMSHFLHQCSNWWFLTVVALVLIFSVLLWVSS